MGSTGETDDSVRWFRGDSVVEGMLVPIQNAPIDDTFKNWETEKNSENRKNSESNQLTFHKRHQPPLIPKFLYSPLKIYVFVAIPN